MRFNIDLTCIMGVNCPLTIDVGYKANNHLKIPGNETNYQFLDDRMWTLSSSPYPARKIATSNHLEIDSSPHHLILRWLFAYYIYLAMGFLSTGIVILSKKIEWTFTLFVTDVTPWVVTSVITSFGVNIEWTGRDSTRYWVVNFYSTGVRIEWNSLLNRGE